MNLEQLDEQSDLLGCDQRWSEDGWSAQQWQRALAQPTRFSGWALCDDAGQAVAVALFSRVLDEVELLRIVVCPGQRGQGLGTELLDATLQQLHRSGSERILLEVRESNQAARALYARSGFSRDGRRADYYPAQGALPAEAAVLMSCQLAEVFS